MPSPDQDQDQAVEQFKIKKLIKSLNNARGNGTSMISLIIPPGDQVSRVSKMLTDEMGTATNIKSRVNRLSVLSAIRSTVEKLKLFNKVPPNGLVIYCGTILTAENKEKKVSYAIEPFKPINTSLYLCDNKFHTGPLSELLQSNDKFGFLVMDGNGSLYGTLAGNTRNVLYKFGVELPKKHGRGGQSAVRFSRLRDEARHNYVRKVAELATQFFITNNVPNITGLVLAGSAEFKNQLSVSDLFDFRLAPIVVSIVDVSYGGENGFNQAIELAAGALANVKFVKEKKLLSTYFSEISQDTGKYCFGMRDTLYALDSGAVETLIVWENLEITRFELKNNSTGVEKVIHLTPEEMEDPSHFIDPVDNVELEVVDELLFVEWVANNYRNFGAKLEFITDCSQEGSQFVKGFGGVGGLLRYQLDFMVLDEFEDNEMSDFDADDFM